MSKRHRRGRTTKSSPRCQNCSSPFVSHVVQVQAHDGTFLVTSCLGCWPAFRSVAESEGGVFSGGI